MPGSGPDVVSARHFDAWWKKRRAKDPHLLDYTLELLIDPSAGDVDVAAFPDSWRQGDLELRVSYDFAPGADLDGVTVHVPLAMLNQVTARGFDWQVPGLRAELVAAVVRSLPKTLRRHFVPVSDAVRDFLARHGPDDGDLTDVLADDLRRRTGELVRPSDWRPRAGARPPPRELPDRGRPRAARRVRQGPRRAASDACTGTSRAPSRGPSVRPWSARGSRGGRSVRSHG